MRCRDVFGTFGRRHTTTTRRNYVDCRAQTGSKPVPSQSSGWTRTPECLAAVVPQHTSATSNLLPKGRFVEETSLRAARRNAGWQNQRAAKNGAKTFERLGPSPPHTTNTQTHTTTLRHFREIRLRQSQTRWSPERLRCSSPRHHCTCSNCSRARAAPSHWHVFSVSYLHAHARLRPRGAEERGAGRKSLPSGRQ